LVEAREHLGDMEWSHCTYAQLTRSKLPRVFEQMHAFALESKDLLSESEELLTQSSQRNPAAAAQEKLDPVLFLEVMHLVRYRGLADVQKPSAGGEPAGDSDGMK